MEGSIRRIDAKMTQTRRQGGMRHAAAFYFKKKFPTHVCMSYVECRMSYVVRRYIDFDS